MTTKNFGKAIDRLIGKEHLTRAETYDYFSAVMANRETEMNQGAFLAALTAKGATAEEIAAIWQVVYEEDTVKVVPEIDLPLAENSGTGMDKIKTFNISTAASVVAASCGVAMARHGARAITSTCGTVDVAEAIGINVETDCDNIGKSIEACGIGLFNGMSAKVHPSGLGRILSNISFGSVLNIAASLANPVKIEYGVRGVNDPEMLQDVAGIMQGIGYRRGVVLHGFQDDGTPGIDEASTLGKTEYAEIKADGKISFDTFYPEDFGLKRACTRDIMAVGSVEAEAKRLVQVLSGEKESPESDIVLLNAALLLYVTGISDTMQKGYERAAKALYEGDSYQKLAQWVSCQGEADLEMAFQRLNRFREVV
ncbi:MAG TPA: anthranilate phosphoribosyltransferase [Clostridiales bacterium]|nr:anthranilate phosphoribosyltransferase [Clostridiales bacterium]